MDYRSKTAIYLRKSRSDEASESVEETLSRHLGILTDFAVKNSITVIKIYKEVVSGDGLFTRPQMIALLNDIENGLYTAVLCIDIDRLGRSSTKDSGIILETLRDNGCRIITPDKVYDLENDIDEMTVEMKSFFARQELKSITKRLKRGEIETIKAGGHTGEAPYGYRRIWLGKMPSLEPTSEADIVKMIYDWYVNDGLGSYLISDKLNAMNIPAPGGGRFSRSSVRMILSNPIYTGKIVWNRKKRIKKRRPEDKFREIDNPPELWIEAEGLHEAIISQDQWDEAQRIRKTRSHPPAFKGIVKNPYSGLVYCANCGTAIQRQYSIKAGERLLCPTTACNGSVRLDMFSERLKGKLQEALDGLRLRLNERKAPETAAKDNQIQLIEKQLKTVIAQRSRLHDLLEQGVYDVPMFMERQAALTERQGKLEKELDALKSEMQEDANKITPAEAIPKIEYLLNNWDSIEPLDKNNILKAIISRITYKRDSRKFSVTEFDTEIQWRF